MKKSKNIAWGIVLILIAAFLVVNNLGIVPTIPFFSIAFAAVCLYFFVRGIVKVNFFEIFFSAALAVCIFDDELQKLTNLEITKLTPWIVLLVALLLTIAFELIFKRSGNRHFGVNVKGAKSENITNGRGNVSGAFTSTTKYINGEFDDLELDNAFGKMVVYFDNAIIKNGRAKLEVDNSFGEVQVYLPKTWRVDLKQDAAFGNVKMIGCPNNDADAPLLVIEVDTSFGDTCIFFE